MSLKIATHLGMIEFVHTLLHLKVLFPQDDTFPFASGLDYKLALMMVHPMKAASPCQFFSSVMR